MLNLTIVYIVLIFLVLRFCVTLFNFLSNPKLGKYGKHFSDQVSVLIDANGDNTGLLKLLRSLQEQDYQQIEVLISLVNPADNNDELAHFCRTDPRFKVAASTDHNPAAQATGTFLLFLGVNTVIQKGFINSLIYRTRVFKLALLSIIPTQAFSGLADYCLIPLNNYVLLNLTPLRLIRLSSSPVFSAGSNQCMFFDAAVYREYEWEQRFSGRLTEALEVVKSVKQEKFKAETLLGNRLIYTVIPDHIDGVISKTGDLLFKKFGNNVFAASLYLLLLVGGPVLMLANYEYSLLILPVGLIFLTRVMISFLSGQNALWNVLLHPVQMLLLLISLSAALLNHIRRQFLPAN